MQIPKLANAERRREFDDYSHEEHVKVIKAYLFDGMSYRKIDRMVLKLDENHTRGWQSMGILHYLGIKDPFKGIFKGMDVKDAIEQIKLTGDDSYNELLGYLSDEEISIKLCNEDVEQEKADSYCIEKDMIVVCSNCHRMIHRRRNAVLTLDELKSMITIVE